MSDPADWPWQKTTEGLALSVRLTPRDALDGVDTLADGRSVLKARVRAAPTEGEANAALIQLLAKEFGLPRSQLSITAGATARVKTVALQGETESLIAALKVRLDKR